MVHSITGRTELTFQEDMDFLRRARGKMAKMEGDTWEMSERITVMFIYCSWVVTRWQWLFHMYTKHEIGYY